MTNKTERLLINSSSPTLLGIKPASLISVNKDEFNLFYKELFLTDFKKIKFKVISFNKNKITILIYHVKKLNDLINNKENRLYLSAHYYKNFNSLDLLLDELKGRINKYGLTPEIGLFLGISLDDLLEFEKGNKNYLFLGYWQVFHLEEEKRRLFKLFDKCKASLNNLFINGKSIEFLLN